MSTPVPRNSSEEDHAADRVLRILHLEDSPLDAELISVRLRADGLSCEINLVDEERGFREGLRRQGLDLILADYSLPLFDGMSALAIARQVCPDIPFLFVSGAIGEEQAIETLMAGAVDYVLKQRLDRLVPSVGRALREAEERTQRRRAEQSLRESEDHLRLAIEAGGIGVWDWDVVGDQLIWSDRCKALFGLRSDAQISSTIFESLLHPDDREQAWQVLNRCLEQHRDYSAEYRIVWPDGSVHWILDKGQAVYGPAGQTVHVHGVVMDITERRQAHDQLEIRVGERTAELAQANAALKAEVAERKRAETELRRVNKALRILSECNQILVRSPDEAHLLRSICQVAVDFGGYQMVWVGEAQHDEQRSVQPLAWAGCDEGYLEQMQITWADTERGCGPTGKAVRTGHAVVQRNLACSPEFAPWRAEALKRGWVISMAAPLVIDGRIYGAMSFYSADPGAFDEAEVRLLQELADDLAFGLSSLRLRGERQRALEALQASEERNRRIVETAEEGIWVLDDADNTLFINQKMARMLCYAVEEVVGTPILAYVDERDRPFVENALRRRRAGIKDTQDVRFRGRDGSELWVILAGAPIFDEAGRYQGALKMATDITERKRLERSIAEISTLEQQRMGRDLHDVLGQNLTGISFLSKILEQKLDALAMTEAQDAVEIGRLATLTNKQVRSLARGLSPVELTAANFEARIREFAIGVQDIFSISCACQCDGHIRIPGDETAVHLYRIAQEAVNNAVKHGKARNIMIQLMEEGGRGMLIVQDDGRGMPKDSEKHNGMGLRIMNYRASAIGGQLRFRSNANNGTVVICSFDSPGR